MSDEVSDEQLVARAANRDPAALERLYDRYASAVMGIALRIVGDRALAEEIVQETFWRVWRSAEAFVSGRGAFAGWLFGIVHNLSIDYCRRRKARPQAMATDDKQSIDWVADSEVDVAESAWTSIKHQQVRAAIADLPIEQRRVIELAYFGGLTRQEIAAATGEPLGTIHTRARLALRKLREALSARGFED